MSYARAFERELLRRSLGAEAPKTPTPAPAGPAKGKERDTYIGFLEGQLDKISVTADLAKLLAEKVEGLQGTLSLHEERLLNQARLLNLTQEAMDQSAQKTTRLVADLRTRLDGLDTLQSSRGVRRQEPSLTASQASQSSSALEDLQRAVKDLEKRFHTLRVSALVATDSTLSARIDELRDSLDTLRMDFDAALQKLRSELARTSDRTLATDAALQRHQQRQQQQLAVPSRQLLRGLLEDALDEFLPILLREIKAFVHGNVDDVRLATGTVASELHTLKEAVQRLRSAVAELQKGQGVPYLTRSSTDAITLATTMETATSPKRGGDAAQHGYAQFRPLEPPCIPVAIPVVRNAARDTNLLDEEHLTAKIRALLADALDKVTAGDEPSSQKLADSSCEAEAGVGLKTRPTSGKRTPTTTRRAGGSRTTTGRTRGPGR
ncbi:hypothetical protein GMRT_10552 [Giardia muris]|uniref:Uncharacterized protein n=1 Tax=Giardia muris TaxID=5742 RepID=A0A4Z1T2S2_GIAMU|nr:hypothetical protein GMRT_10552 [Giardia muris]|eukprot:TNJ26869.1 hypothetical protein GMRT_10552 [Giardia muris]